MPESLRQGIALLLLAFGGLLTTGSAAGGPVAASSPSVPDAYSQRRLQALELTLAQLHRREGRGGELGMVNWSGGVLVAGALAVAGRPTLEDVSRWAGAALGACAGRWQKLECQRLQLSLERLVLQFPAVLPADLLPRLRAAAAVSSPPPGAAAVAHPWDFAETENQRILSVARNLGAQVVAGTPDSAAARGWGAYADAFLAAHDRDGWYEEESSGYLAASIASVLHLADFAPQPPVKELARRQLSLLFAAWAQRQVAGFPAGVASRTYAQWALGASNTPWQAWAWLAAGMGRADRFSFMEWPELAVSPYRIPAPICRLLAERRSQPAYEIEVRRRIAAARRRPLDAALYSYATPDYILSAAQAVGGLRFVVSGGQEVLATLFPEGEAFAPLYLWSRTRNQPSERWKSWGEQDLTAGHRNVVLAHLGQGEEAGHAYLAAGWAPPEPSGDAVVSRRGGTYVSLSTVGGWEIAPAGRKFPDYYGGAAFAGSWVAVPRRQPADVALEVGRQAEQGDFAAWKAHAAKSRLAVAAGELHFTAGDGRRISFLPGRWAAAGGVRLQPEAYPRLQGPFLASREPGRWSFSFAGDRFQLEKPVP